jgi:DNA polymerase-3 subunit gamma/tau
MPFASLYQKYRPQTFSEIIGQPHVAKTLANAVERGHIFHAYLFSGPRGTGKTSTARILAKAVNCEKGPTPEPCGMCQPCTEIAAGTFSDVFEIDAATHSKVEETRDFLSNVPTGLSALSRKKFYIVDEVHMLSSHAFNALLKTLEEPPEHVVFVLATTEPHKVPPTIAGRCQHFEFRLIPPSDLAEHYKSICQKEAIEFEDEAIQRVAALARGSARDGLSLLDQLLAATGGNITVESVSLLVGDDEVELSAALARSIATGDLEKCLDLLSNLAESGKDYRAFAQRFASYLRNLMVASYLPSKLTQVVASTDPETAVELSDLAKLLGRPAILRCLEIAGEVLSQMASGAPPQLALELGIVRMCRPEESPSAADLAKKIEELSAKLARLEQHRAAEPTRDNLPAKPAAAVGGTRQGSPGPAPEAQRRSPTSVASNASHISSKPEDLQARPAEAGAGSSLQDLWIRLLAALKDAKKMKAHALLQEATPIDIQDSALVLEYTEKYEYHAKNAETLTDSIADQTKSIFGRPLGIVARVVREPMPESSPTSADESDKKSASSSDPEGGDTTVQEIERLVVEELGGTPVPDDT